MNTIGSVFASSAGTGVAAKSLGTVGPVTATQSGFGTLGSSTGLGFDFFNDLPSSGQVASSVSPIVTGFSKYNEGMFAARQSGNNAAVERRNANLSLAQASIKAEDLAERGRLQGSTIVSRFSKAGVVTTAGSPLLVRTRQAQETEDDIVRARFQGAIEASNFTNQANALDAQAKSQRGAARMGLATTLLKPVLSGF